MTERETAYNNLLEYLLSSTKGKDYQIEGLIRPYGARNGKIRVIKVTKPGALKSEILFYKHDQIAVNGNGFLMGKIGGFYRSEGDIRERFDKILGN